MHNYTSPGEKIFTCTAVSLDGIESKSITFTIDGLAIENYDILSEDVSKRVVSFDAKNYYWDLETNISVSAEGDSFSQKADIAKDASVMVFTEVNYSSDGAKSYEVNLISGDVSENYTHSFSMEGVSIENYERTHKNDTNYVLAFDLRNSWYSGEVNWSVTDPSISNTSNLENNESVIFLFK